MRPRGERSARGVAFNSILWPLGIGVALVVAFWPLMEEIYARVAWQRVPCHVFTDSATGGGEQFYFEHNGKKYVCTRRNFWPAKNQDAHETSVEDPAADNGVCYVNGATPPTAVLYLDAYRHLEQGIGQYIGAGMVLLATAVIAIGGTRAKRRAEATAAVPPAGGNGGGA